MQSGLMLAGLVMFCAAQQPPLWQSPAPEDRLWTPIRDEVYLQESPENIVTEDPVNTVAVLNGRVYTGGGGGVSILDGGALRPVEGQFGAVDRLMAWDGHVWVAGPGGLWRGDGTVWTRVLDKPVAGLCPHNNRMVAVSEASLFEIDGDTAACIAEKGAPGVLGVASYAGALYAHNGKRVGILEDGGVNYEGIADWGHLPHGCAVRDLLALGSRLYVAGDEGLSVLRGTTWYQIRGEEGLCNEDATCLARGFENDLWIGTTRGAVRNVNNQYQFFGHPRWIPHDKVNGIAADGRTVYLATDGGLGIITYEPYTLAKKADYYERWLEEWGQKRLGFIHGLFLIDGEWLREVSDNDVGFSSHYLAAKCFQYAVTGDPKVRAEAVDMMKSVAWSGEITPMDGFPARSIYAVGEKCLKADHGSGGLPAEWHPTPDGQWEWKGDTSSDETDAHVYETFLFLRLVANDEERVWATRHLHRLVSHIADNGFVLRDLDGKPTRWARWDPEYLHTPYGYYARGLNGLEAFNYMTTAHQLTGDPKFLAAKEKLIGWNYAPDILRQKLAYHPGEITYFDDRLAFYAYFPLIQCETDQKLMATWRRSLERSWEIKRIEAVPWFNFIYGALTGNDCEAERAVAHLREWPLDLRRHSFTNSHRDDLHTPDGYRAYAERIKPLSPRETGPNRWDGDFMELDGGNAGRAVADPGGWLDAYWMGRYHGFITPPETQDGALTTVPRRGLTLGAKPYDGPPRPRLSFETSAE